MQNSIYKIKYFFISVLGLGGVVFDSGLSLGDNTSPLKETLLEIRGGNVFTA